jgi:SAM-dependent methyltransferase
MIEHQQNPWLAERAAGRLLSGDAYDAPYEARAARGVNVHGEADCVMRFAPRAVLDAGCGTGRVARELARRGMDVTGVDLDAEMLATARRKAPYLDWRLADLATVDPGRTFDVVLLAGNVIVFLTPGSEGAVLSNLSCALTPGGVLIAGFQTERARLSLAEYDRLAATAGLSLAERWASWDVDPWREGSDYAVSVYRHNETKQESGQ